MSWTEARLFLVGERRQRLSVGVRAIFDTYFQKTNIIFDTTFCGSWAGRVVGFAGELWELGGYLPGLCSE